MTPALLKHPAAEHNRIGAQITDMMSVRDRLKGVITTALNFDTDRPHTR